jgi:hypothetical protein
MRRRGVAKIKWNVPCKKMRRPIEAIIKTPLDLDIVDASPSSPFLSASDTLCTLRDDLAIDDRVPEDGEWRSRGARSPDPFASTMLIGHEKEMKNWDND